MRAHNQNPDLKRRCFDFSLAAINLMDSLPRKRSALVIENQLVRSATSIGTNLVEARSSSSRLEFKKFNEIALKSVNETIYWLELLREAKFVSPEKVSELLNEANQLANMLGSGVLKLKKRF